MSQASPCSETTFVLLGKVLKAHGIRGELKVQPYTEAPECFSQYQRLYLTMDGQPPNMPAPFWTNRHSQGAGQKLILQLAECTSREQAEALCGATIWLPAAELPPLPEGEFYLHSLQGKEVRLLGAEAPLGHVTGLLSTLKQDILVIRQDEDEFLVPAVRDFFVRRGPKLAWFCACLRACWRSTDKSPSKGSNRCLGKEKKSERLKGR